MCIYIFHRLRSTRYSFRKTDQTPSRMNKIRNTPDNRGFSILTGGTEPWNEPSTLERLVSMVRLLPLLCRTYYVVRDRNIYQSVNIDLDTQCRPDRPDSQTKVYKQSIQTNKIDALRFGFAL